MDSIITSATAKEEEVISYLFILQLFSEVASLALSITASPQRLETERKNIAMTQEINEHGIDLEDPVGENKMIDHEGTAVEGSEEYEPNHTSAASHKVRERDTSYPTLAIRQRLQQQMSDLSLATRQSSLESLPVEIQLMILHELSNTQDLSAIVHASPLMRMAYLSAREELYTYVTLNELASRGIDVLSSMSILEVRTKRGVEPSDLLRCALLELLDFQGPSGAHSCRIPKLEIQVCLALQTLYDIVKWEVLIDESTREFNVSFFSDPLDNFLYWQEHDSYHVITLGEYACIEYKFVELVYAEWLAEDEPGLSQEKRQRRDKMRLRRELADSRRDSESSSGSVEDD